jgi:hypothetical protein
MKLPGYQARIKPDCGVSCDPNFPSMRNPGFNVDPRVLMRQKQARDPAQSRTGKGAGERGKGIEY